MNQAMNADRRLPKALVSHGVCAANSALVDNPPHTKTLGLREKSLVASPHFFYLHPKCLHAFAIYEKMSAEPSHYSL